MALTEMLTSDAHAVVLICSTVGLPSGESLRPYGPRSWAKFAARMDERGVDGPGALIGLAADDLLSLLAYPPAEADRLARLLDRGTQAAVELERLVSRGIWVSTILDDRYPLRLRARLGADAPPILFGAGSHSLLELDGLAIVGSRAADEQAIAFADGLAAAAVAGGLAVISGGARGIDQTAMRSAFGRGGRVIGVLPEGLEKRIREVETRTGLADGELVLVSAVHPSTSFNVGTAMARNKMIYALSAATAIASSAAGEGGTWAGAVEALERRYAPVLVRSDANAPAGNAELIARGGIALADGDVPDPLTREELTVLTASFETRAAEDPAPYGVQETLFG